MTANSDDAKKKKKTSKISINWKTTTSKDRQRFDFDWYIPVYKYYIQLGRPNVFTVLIVPVFFLIASTLSDQLDSIQDLASFQQSLKWQF